MKINYFIIIIFSYIGLILNKEYDLISGQSLNLTTLDYGITYKFFIEAKYEQKVQVSMHSASNFSIEQKIYYYEYLDRIALFFLNNETSYARPYNSTIYFNNYEITKNITKYVAFEITPDIQMLSVEITATVFDTMKKQIKDFFSSFFIAILIVPISVCVGIILIVICLCNSCILKKKMI